MGSHTPHKIVMECFNCSKQYYSPLQGFEATHNVILVILKSRFVRKYRVMRSVGESKCRCVEVSIVVIVTLISK